MPNTHSRIPVLRRPVDETVDLEMQKSATTTKTTKDIRTTKPATVQKLWTPHDKTIASQPQRVSGNKSSTDERATPEQVQTDKILISKDIFGLAKEARQAVEQLAANIEKDLLSERPKRAEPDLSVRWQTANIVLHAFAPFVWAHISDEHKEELMKYGMNNFLDVQRAAWGKSSPASDIASPIYFGAIDANLTCFAERIIIAKEDASKRRDPLARPHISDAVLRDFLTELELPGLSPLEVAGLTHIKLTVNTAANIEEANCDSG